MDRIQKNYNIREYVTDQFCSEENRNYLVSMIKQKIEDDKIRTYILTNLDTFIRNFNRRFGKSEAIYDDPTTVKTLKTDDTKMWDGVRRLNQMFLSLLFKEYTEDFKDDAISRYGYLDSMFISTELRPCGYEGLNDDTIPAFTLCERSDRSCPKDILQQDPYNRYHAAYMNVKVYDMNRTEINGNDRRLPYYNEYVDGVSWFIDQSRDDSTCLNNMPSTPLSKNSNSESVASSNSSKETYVASPMWVNDQIFPEELTPKVRRDTPVNVKLNNLDPHYYSATCAYDNEYPGGQQQLARDIHKNMDPLDRELAERSDKLTYRNNHRWGDDKFPIWRQNLSKRNYERKQDFEEHDDLDASITEMNNYPQGGQNNARKELIESRYTGDGYRFGGVVTNTAPQPGKVSYRNREDEHTHYNRELGYKLKKQELSSMFDWPKRYNRTERQLIPGMDNRTIPLICGDC